MGGRPFDRRSFMIFFPNFGVWGTKGAVEGAGGELF